MKRRPSFSERINSIATRVSCCPDSSTDGLKAGAKFHAEFRTTPSLGDHSLSPCPNAAHAGAGSDSVFSRAPARAGHFGDGFAGGGCPGTMRRDDRARRIVKQKSCRQSCCCAPPEKGRRRYQVFRPGPANDNDFYLLIASGFYLWINIRP